MSDPNPPTMEPAADVQDLMARRPLPAVNISNDVQRVTVEDICRGKYYLEYFRQAVPAVNISNDDQRVIFELETALKPPIFLTVEDICKAYFGRKKALKAAILNEFKQLYRECHPKKGKLSLLAFEDGTWEVVRFGSTNSIPHPIEIPERRTPRSFRFMLASKCDSWLYDQSMISCTDQAQWTEVSNITSRSARIGSLIPIKSKRKKQMKRNNMMILRTLVEEDDEEEEEEEAEMRAAME
ncbi:hypothetical protein LIER_39078 [Lithospermum erythrorhizon]|uniref:Alfin N-terminal domain-containing protein n=1 Tax=Lithospermum erythrorhizon TaxID=34254 RepID=A0AAV3QCK1_LITER